MSRKGKREGNANPAHEIAPGLVIRAGGGGHIVAATYDGEPVILAPLPPSRIERVVSEVPTRPATAAELAAMRPVEGSDPRD